jgi:hypothetical protein
MLHGLDGVAEQELLGLVWSQPDLMLSAESSNAKYNDLGFFIGVQMNRGRDNCVSRINKRPGAYKLLINFRQV